MIDRLENPELISPGGATCNSLGRQPQVQVRLEFPAPEGRHPKCRPSGAVSWFAFDSWGLRPRLLHAAPPGLRNTGYSGIFGDTGSQIAQLPKVLATESPVRARQSVTPKLNANRGVSGQNSPRLQLLLQRLDQIANSPGLCANHDRLLTAH
jgi:hypothetical protein